MYTVGEIGVNGGQNRCIRWVKYVYTVGEIGVYGGQKNKTKQNKTKKKQKKTTKKQQQKIICE